MKQKLTSDFLGKIFFFFGVLILILIFANVSSDYANFSFTYTMDELSDLGTIKQFIIPDSLSSFFINYFWNDPIRYHGFITLFIPGFLGYIPSLVYGDAAYIYSMRICSFLLTLVSYCLFAFTLTKNYWKRSFVLLFYICLPSTAFLFVIPRVEAYQLFFLALYFYFYVKEGLSEKCRYLFLGLAFASRISTAPLIIFLFVAEFVIHNASLKEKMKIFFKEKVSWLYLGICIGQPHLIIPANIFYYVKSKITMVYNDTGVNPSIDVWWWFKSTLNSYFFNEMIGIMFIAASLVISIYVILKSKSKNQFTLAVASLSSLVALLMIIFTVKLNYSFWYVHSHIILVFLFLFYISRGKKTFLILLLAFCSFMILLRFPSLPFYRSADYEIHKILKRTDDPLTNQRLERYHIMVKTLEIIREAKNKTVRYKVHRDEFFPSLDWGNGFKCSSATFYEEMNDQYDVIFHTYSARGPAIYPSDENIQNLPMKSEVLSDRDHYYENFENFNKFVSKEDGGKCDGNNCYYEFLLGTGKNNYNEDIRFVAYVKKDILNIIRAKLLEKNL